MDREGFELHRNDIPEDVLNAIDFRNFKDVVTKYYPEIEKFVKKVTKADHVFCFDHNIRRSAYVEQKNTNIKTQPPIPQIHTDYTPTSAPRRLLDLTKRPKVNDSYACFRAPEDADKPLISKELAEKCKRFCIINVWRSVSDEGPIQQYPLAVCAANTLKYPDDFVVFEIQYQDRIGENWFVRDSGDPHHKWFYFPQMAKHEALIFKQWDSEGRVQREVVKELLETLEKREDIPIREFKQFIEKTSSLNGQGNASEGFGDFCIHSAFQGPDEDKLNVEDVPARESIEVRLFVLYE